MATLKEVNNLAALRASIASTTALLRNFEKALQNPLQPLLIPSPPNPLQLLLDASSILKAQSTKLSILLLNKPFTPTAITFILTSLSGECLPALMSALELCPPPTYTNFLHQHIRTLLSRAFRELLALLSSIPHDEHGIEGPRGRDTLASTGVLWDTCDNMAKLASTGLVALAAERVELYHGLLKDAIDELEEWDPNEDTDSEDTSSSPNSPSLDPPSSANHSSSATTIVSLRAKTLSLLRLLRLFYLAIKKHRVRSFPNITSTTSSVFPTRSQCESLDRLLALLQSFSEQADEIAGALYEANSTAAARRLGELREGAIDIVGGVRSDWNDKEDGFSAWAGKWLGRLEEIGGHDDGGCS